ncbi:Polygalacturonase inhibitor [Nymphaea thermarum]|nr:Polygalacturonase inhibitor [Nymphaea thermarum]
MPHGHTTIFLITTLLILLTQPPPASAALCHLNESSALLRFKQNIQSFLFPGALSSWQGNGSDCCRWEGITCNNITGFVIELQISNVAAQDTFIGSIDPSLFELKQLQLLDLSYNGFNGSIPNRLVELTHLTHLDLSGCHFSGQIPEELLEMTWLISLNLSMNDGGLQLQHPNFTELVRRLDQLQHLQLNFVEVNMSSKDVSTVLLSSPSLHKLQTLSLGWCNIFGPLLDKLFLHMQSLSYLDLSGNNLQEVPKFLDNLTSLNFLYLAGCGLQGNFPPSIFLLPKLERLYISSNRELTVLLPPRNLTRNVNIQRLYLSSIKELSDGPLVPSNPPLLPSLEVKSNPMNGSILSSCISSRNFVRNFSSDNPPGLIPEDYMLQGSNFSGYFTLHGEIVQTIKGNDRPITNIEGPMNIVDMSNNYFIGEILEEIGRLKYLRGLNVSINHLKGPIPNSFGNLLQLEWFDLSQNQLSGLIPERKKERKI